MQEKFTIGLLVSNHFGVLNRVAGLYSKRGYNIDSLAVGETENPEYSRMTIVSTGDEYMKEQVVKQLQKLHDVKQVSLFDQSSMVSNEHMLIKLLADSEQTAKISDFINTYGGKVMDFGSDFITAEITGESKKVEEFLKGAAGFGILETCRSGAISMVHGTENMLSVKNL